MNKNKMKINATFLKSALKTSDQIIKYLEMLLRKLDIFDIAQICVIIAHISINWSPHNESLFITNNIHDFLNYGFKFERECFSKDCYKEHEYSFTIEPECVERSFIPSLILALIVYPFHFLSVECLHLSIHFSLLFARLILGIMMFSSLKYIKNTIRKVLENETTAKCFGILVLMQLTVLFDGTHFLYNTCAMILTNFAYAFWMQNKWHYTITFLACATIIFRCDTIVFTFALITIDLVRLRLPIMKCLIWGSISSVIFIAVTVLIDSHIWGIWIWPEFQVFHFNTILNLSSHWGVHPWHAYFTNMLPMNITIVYPLAIFTIFYNPNGSLVDWNALNCLSPALFFVCLYSFLPHKEYRFIFSAYPIFTVCASIGMEKILNPKLGRKIVKKTLYMMLILMLYLGIFSTIFATLYFSSEKYGLISFKDLNAEISNEYRDLHLIFNPNILHYQNEGGGGLNKFLFENKKFGWRYKSTNNMSKNQFVSFTHIISHISYIPGFHVYKAYPIKPVVDVYNWKIVFTKHTYIHERDDVHAFRQKYYSF